MTNAPENTPQPLDALMTRLGLTNADLVKASTEQLTFKMVHKGRVGRRLSPNVQEKIHNALLAAKPGLNVRRRDLFRYEPGEAFVAAIADARRRTAEEKLKYPEYARLLADAGVSGYSVDVASHRITYFGTGGEAHEEQGISVGMQKPGVFNEAGVRAAIADAQSGSIDFQAFLRRLFEAGIVRYEVNLRSWKIDYCGADQSYREKIGDSGAAAAPVSAVPKTDAQPKKKTVKKNKTRSLTRKARLSSNKRWRQKQKDRRRR